MHLSLLGGRVGSLIGCVWDCLGASGDYVGFGSLRGYVGPGLLRASGDIWGLRGTLIRGCLAWRVGSLKTFPSNQLVV